MKIPSKNSEFLEEENLTNNSVKRSTVREMLTNISKHIHQFREIFQLTNPFLCVWERDGTHLAT